MSNEEMIEKLESSLRNICEVQQHFKKRSSKKYLYKAISRIVWTLIWLEEGENL
jgi:hypothetical protein